MFRSMFVCFVALLVVSTVLGCPPANKAVVPDVSGMTQLAASLAITAAGLTVGTVDTAYSQTVPLNQVVSQNPPANTKVNPGSFVNLVISLGSAPSVAWWYQPTLNTVTGLTINTTSDGGCVVSGGRTGDDNMYALKLNVLGQYGWDGSYSNASQYGSHNELWPYVAHGIQQTPDGGYIMLSSGGVDDDTLAGEAFLLVKLDQNGDVVWSKAYAPENPYSPGNPCAITKPAALQITSDGGYVAFGSSYVGGFYLASILKTDADGNKTFCKVINDNEKKWDQDITGGQQTADDGYILTGYSDNQIEAERHGYMALLIKLDEDGELDWSETYQDVPNGHGLECLAVTQTFDGGYVIGGEEINSITKVSTYGFWLGKVLTNGTLDHIEWLGHGPTVHYATCIKETPSGDLIVGGLNNVGVMTIAKFTAGLTLLWNFEFPEEVPNAEARSIALTDDGGCYVVGSGGSGGTVVAKVNHVFIP